MRKLVLSLLVVFCFAFSGCDSVKIITSTSVFHEMPLQFVGSSFAILPSNEEQKNNQEFKYYSKLISEFLTSKGLVNKDTEPGSCNYIVKAEYGIDNGKEHISSVPIMGQTGTSSSTTNFYGNTAYTTTTPRYGVVGSSQNSFVVYSRHLLVKVYQQLETGELKEVYRGSAISNGATNQLATVFPYMATSLLQNFPGKSGSTDRVNLPLKTLKKP